MDISVLVAYPSVWNFAIAAVGLVIALVRIRYEEQVLTADSHYHLYRARVQFRLVPGVH